MAYYVDTCAGFIEEFPSGELQEAKERCEKAIQDAKDFQAKMGFVPFWGRGAVEIRQGKSGLNRHIQGQDTMARVVANTKIYKVYRA